MSERAPMAFGVGRYSLSRQLAARHLGLLAQAIGRAAWRPRTLRPLAGFRPLPHAAPTLRWRQAEAGYALSAQPRAWSIARLPAGPGSSVFTGERVPGWGDGPTVTPGAGIPRAFEFPGPERRAAQPPLRSAAQAPAEPERPPQAPPERPIPRGVLSETAPGSAPADVARGPDVEPVAPPVQRREAAQGPSTRAPEPGEPAAGPPAGPATPKAREAQPESSLGSDLATAPEAPLRRSPAPQGAAKPPEMVAPVARSPAPASPQPPVKETTSARAPSPGAVPGQAARPPQSTSEPATDMMATESPAPGVQRREEATPRAAPSHAQPPTAASAPEPGSRQRLASRPLPVSRPGPLPLTARLTPAAAGHTPTAQRLPTATMPPLPARRQAGNAGPVPRPAEAASPSAAPTEVWRAPIEVPGTEPAGLAQPPVPSEASVALPAQAGASQSTLGRAADVRGESWPSLLPVHRPARPTEGAGMQPAGLQPRRVGATWGGEAVQRAAGDLPLPPVGPRRATPASPSVRGEGAARPGPAQGAPIQRDEEDEHREDTQRPTDEVATGTQSLPSTPSAGTQRPSDTADAASRATQSPSSGPAVGTPATAAQSPGTTAESPGAVTSAGTQSPAVATAGVTQSSGAAETGTAPDIDELARDVYEIIRRRLRVEAERARGGIF